MSTTSLQHHLGAHALHHDSDAARLAVEQETQRELEQQRRERTREERAWVAGRLLMGLVFLVAAVGKAATFGDTSRLLADHGFAGPSLLLALAISVELTGGVFLAMGLEVRRASIALIGWVALVTVLVHLDLTQAINRAAVVSNLAIAAGLLLLAARGAGAASADRVRERKLAGADA